MEDYDTEEYYPETQELHKEINAHEWAESLCHDDLMSLTLLLHSLLVYRLHFPLTEAAKLISEMVSVSKGTVWEWSLFVKRERHFSWLWWGSLSVIWCCLGQNTRVKGKKNLTSVSSVNEVLLVNSVLEPGYPRKISKFNCIVKAAQSWVWGNQEN